MRKKRLIAVLSGSNGKVETEIIPPISPEPENAVDRIYNDRNDVFAEMKRLGD
jgi:hypothetical protein